MTKLVPEAFHNLVVNDPLFAMEGVDVENLEASIENLRLATQGLETAFTHNNWVRRLFFTAYPLAEYVFPVRFLSLCAQAERARRAYLEKPHMDTARALLSSWHVASTHYKRALRRYVYMHRVLFFLEKKGPSFTFQDIAGNITTYDEVWAIMREWMDNAKILQRHVRVYTAVLETGVVSSLSPRKVAWLPPITNGVLEATQRHLYELELKHMHPYVVSDIQESFGPFPYTVSLFDGVDTEYMFAAHVVRHRETGVRSLSISVVGDYFFLPLGGDDESRYAGLGSATFSALIERGVPYWCQQMTRLYGCRDQTYQVDIATMVDLVRRPELDAAKVTAQKSSLLDLLVETGALDVRIYTAHTWNRVRKGALTRKFSFLFGLLMRTHPSLYFLPFNQSVWRLDAPPRFMGVRRALVENQFYKRAKDVVPQMGNEALEMVFRGAEIRRQDRIKQALGSNS